tara:strand:+ start:28778 stop:29635 length:858 start_codon:yes stop_codon:yes gene_type:complete
MVLGGNGYLGRHLSLLIEKSGYELVLPKSKDGSRVDLVDKFAVSNLDWNVDLVFVFAGKTGTSIGFERYENFVLGNELILLNVLDSIRASRFSPRVIFPSTRLVYRGADSPIAENGEVDIKTIYAANKMCCENLLGVYNNAYGIDYTILRICVPYADVNGNEYSFGTVGSFIKQAKANNKIRVYGDGAIYRTFTHVMDVVRFVFEAAISDSTKNAVYNVPGENLSLYQIAESIAHKYAASVENVEWPDIDFRIETGSTMFDGSKLQNVLSISTEYSFYAWLDELY